MSKPYEFEPLGFDFGLDRKGVWIAAQKKLLEYLQNKYQVGVRENDGSYSKCPLVIPINEWQSLLKEFEVKK